MTYGDIRSLTTLAGRLLRADFRHLQQILKILIEEVIDTLFPPSSVTITLPKSMPAITGDRSQVARIFENLISNAIKYSDRPDGTITILTERSDGYYLFGVRDNGPGINPPYYDRIFQIFQTLHTRDDVESTGVGLTIDRKKTEERIQRYISENKQKNAELDRQSEQLLSINRDLESRYRAGHRRCSISSKQKIPLSPG